MATAFEIGTDVPCMCAAWGDASEIVDVSEEMKGIALSNAELVQCALQVLLTRTCSVQAAGDALLSRSADQDVTAGGASSSCSVDVGTLMHRMNAAGSQDQPFLDLPLGHGQSLEHSIMTTQRCRLDDAEQRLTTPRACAENMRSNK